MTRSDPSDNRKRQRPVNDPSPQINDARRVQPTDNHASANEGLNQLGVVASLK